MDFVSILILKCTLALAASTCYVCIVAVYTAILLATYSILMHDIWLANTLIQMTYFQGYKFQGFQGFYRASIYNFILELVKLPGLLYATCSFSNIYPQNTLLKVKC